MQFFSESSDTESVDKDLDFEKDKDITRSSEITLDYARPSTIIRYNNKLYITRRHYSITYFHEYYLYKLQPSEYSYEFYLDRDKKIFETHRDRLDNSYKSLMYTKVLNEMRVLPVYANIEKEFIDCLQVRYNEGTIITASPQEIQEREAYHRTLFQNTISELFTKISVAVYESAKKGYVGTEITPTCSENELTSYKKYPIFYTIPNGDGTLRPTYSEYFYYIVSSCYPEYGEIDAMFSEQDRLGIILCKKLKNIYSSLEITYTFTKNLLPTLHIVFPISVNSTFS